MPTAWPKTPTIVPGADLAVRTPAPAAGETFVQKRTPRNVPWPTTRPLREDQPTDPTADAGLLADIVAALPHPVVALDADGLVVFWSDAAAEVFGWSAAEAVGRSPTFLPADRFTEHVRLFVRATTGVRVREFATDRRHRDGRQIPVLVTMSVDAGGGVVCVYQPVPDVPTAVAVEDSVRDRELNALLTALAADADNLEGESAEAVRTRVRQARALLSPGPLQAVARPPATGRVIPHAGESALLVDDDDSVRDVAKAVLESVGYGVIEARTGDEAARLAKAVRTLDLVVTDMVLPGLSGRKLMDRLRADRPGLPVVLISGYPQPPCGPEAATHFVKKPFLAQDLLAAVRKVTREVATV